MCVSIVMLPVVRHELPPLADLNEKEIGVPNSKECRLLNVRGVAPTEMRTLLTNTVIIRGRIEGGRFFSTTKYRERHFFLTNIFRR